MSNTPLHNEPLAAVEASLAEALKAAQSLNAKAAKDLRALLRLAAGEIGRIRSASMKAPAEPAAKKASPKPVEAKAAKLESGAKPATAGKKAGQKAKARQEKVREEIQNIAANAPLAVRGKNKKAAAANGVAH